MKLVTELRTHSDRSRRVGNRDTPARVCSAFSGFLLAALTLLIPARSLAQTTYTLPASWAYPPGSQDVSKPGFAGRIHQARKSATLSATVARANAQLDGTLIDPQTGQPYANLVSTNSAQTPVPVKPDGFFAETNVVNYSADTVGQADASGLGGFTLNEGYADANFPGLPGADDSTFTVFENGGNIAIEHTAFLELKAGAYIFGVRCDDTFELAFHRNDSRDLFRVPVAAFGSNRGSTETTASVRVEADGLYSVRLLHAQYQNSPPADLELYTVDANDPNLLTLVNDRTQPGAVKAWQTLTIPTRPYVNRVEPTPDSTGVAQDVSIRAVLVNVGSTPPVMRVNGTVVTPTSSATGNDTVLTYKPAAPFAGGAVVRVEVEYVGAIGSWSFVTRTGVKALMIVGGTATASDNWMASRLASQFGLDVVIKTDSAVTTNDAAGCVLIVNSATVNSGNVAAKNFEELPIPILNGEQANVDDFRLGAAGSNADLREVEIIDTAHPIAAGLALGTYPMYVGGVANQCHPANPDPAAVVVGVNPANQAPLIFAVDTGTEIQGLIHPARRVHMGNIGNDGGNRFNETGVKLFDASIRWLLKLPDAPLRFNPPALANGSVRLSWTGAGTLEEAAAVVGPWTRAVNQTNPQTIPPTGLRFFRLRQ